MIHVQRLSHSFNGSALFTDLSLEISEGASAALIGPSGGGKSTVLKIIAGLIEPTAGTVRVDRTRLGMLFQKNALFDSLTVEENLLFPLRERLGIEGAEARERAAWYLNEVGLIGNEHLYPDEISGGMQKRLGIARALVVDPAIMLYDEPTAGLDPITSRKIADLINHLRERHRCTILTVTNDMQRAYQLGERIYLLAQGKCIDGGTPSDVKASENQWIRQFVYGLRKGPLTA